MTDPPTISLGIHWVAELEQCRPERLSLENVHRCLNEVPARLGLTRVGEALVHERSSDFRNITGVVLIAESHFSVHCFPERRAVHLDLFSCKSVDFDLARRFVVECFDARAISQRLIERQLGDAGQTLRLR